MVFAGRMTHTALSSESTLPDPLKPSELVQELRQALERDELFVCYQPKFRLRSESVDALEALVRWQHPVNGLVPPGQFIGVAEENGLIADLTKWVVERVLLDRERLLADGQDLAVHVNLAAGLAPDRGFADWLMKTCEGLTPGTFGLEITAAALKADPAAALRNFNAMAEAGLMITIDDFGKGAWSMTDLQKTPARELKVERSLVDGLTTSQAGSRLVRAIIDLAHALDMEVTAVGPENDAVLGILRTMGCDLIQGFVISPAIELADLRELLATGADQIGGSDVKRFAG